MILAIDFDVKHNVWQKSRVTLSVRCIAIQIAELLEKQQRVEASCGEVNDRWTGLWRAIEIEPQSPREMRSWLTKKSRLIELAEEVGMDDRENKQLELQIAGLRKVSLDILATCDQDRSINQKIDEYGIQSVSDLFHLAEYRLKSLQKLNA